MPEHNGKCAIWPEFDAREVTDHFQDRSKGSFIHIYESPRAGGRYGIERAAYHELQQPDTSDELRKKVSWWLASQRRQQVEIPRVTSDLLSHLRTQPPLHVVERAGWLLWYLADQTKQIGQTFSLALADFALKLPGPQGTPIYHDDPFHCGALAATQSESMDEIRELAQHLLEKQALRNVVNARGDMRVRVTVAGFEEVQPRPQAPAYAQAFVAMWLDDSVHELYYEGIEPAIRNAGYEPYRVPDDLAVDKIDDTIIANIRQSKFMVADFTHGDAGHRGSVYYEAGFARGLDLEVIRTCRSDLIDDGKLAFDTRQHYHIGWDKDNTDYKAFTKELTNRIIARVGRGPIQDNA